MSDAPAIVWFRRDLRVSDHPALLAAVDSGQPVLCVFIDHEFAGRERGGASKWWLHHSLKSLEADLDKLGARLHILKGEPETLIPKLVSDHGASAVYWNRSYAKASRDMDEAIKSELKANEIKCESFNGALLREPWEIKTGSGGHYKVFTPYWKACLAEGEPPEPQDTPSSITDYSGDVDGITIEELDLLPTDPNWATGFDEWEPGSAGAVKRLETFLDGPVEDYADERNIPSNPLSTSKLSPHLAFGEISPREIWKATKAKSKDNKVFLSEIGWREFSYVLLFYNPDLATENYNDKFNAFPWSTSAKALQAWQKGQTGYPFVDAGLRQLWATGWMHNRVRMVVGSFLVKHLRRHWTNGEDWFWDTLVDADPASNAASWQWVAGSGADAAPYFRIFNPFTQGEKFDKEGDYVRKWVPELADLPKKYIHRPWEAPKHVLAQAGVKLGQTYPHPIVDHKEAREKALEGYEKTKGQKS